MNVNSKVKWLVFIMMLLLLSGCASNNGSNTNSKTSETNSGNTSGDKVVVKMATFENDPNGMMEAARNKFNEEHENIELEFVKMPIDATQMHDRTVTIMASKSDELDIVNLDVVWVAEFAEAGWLIPLNDQFPADTQKEFIPASIDAMNYNDKIWAVPWMNDMHTNWYRKDLLEKYNFNPPVTYEEAFEQAKVISKAEGVSGFTMHWGKAEQLVVSFTEFVHANGGDFYDADGNVIIDSPEAVEALKFMVKMLDEGLVSKSDLGSTSPEDSRIPFTNGNALFNPNWGYVYQLNEGDDSAVKGKTWIQSNLKFEGGRNANSVGGWNFAISDYSKNKDAAMEVINWFTSFENQKFMMMGGGYIGTRSALAEDAEIVVKFPFLDEYNQVFKDGSVRPKAANYAEVSNLTQTYVHRALSKEITPADALKQLADELKKL